VLAPLEWRIVLTCEHGGRRVPREHRRLFVQAQRELATHRGYDIGALELARELSRRLAAPLIASTTTRLLVDLNRSAVNPAAFSRWTRGLDSRAKSALLRRHHAPHRRAVFDAIECALPVIHVAVHSFTPELRGRTRRTDFGLLFDPGRPRERAFCSAWRAVIAERASAVRVDFNQPYRGWTDGLPTSLRQRWTASRYVGVELEVNQRLAADPRARARAAALLAETLEAVRSSIGRGSTLAGQRGRRGIQRGTAAQ